MQSLFGNWWRFCILLSLSLVLLCSSTAANAGPHRRDVLILHSYHKADWTDSLNKGIMAVLDNYDDVDVHFEYMDTKKLNDEAYLQVLTGIYRRKYADREFAAIITSDDNALKFALANQNGIFKGAPISFCGVNRYKPEMLDGHPKVTGVVEKGDFAETLNAIFKLCPGTKRIFVICDDTKTGMINRQDFMSVLRKQHPNIQCVFSEALSIDQLGQQLRNLPDDSVAFFIAFWRDGKGHTITPGDLEKLFKASSSPVFGRSEWMINRGQTGGKCVSGFHQGQTAATLAGKILDGADPTKLPVILDSPNKFMFDYTELQKHGISVEQLPSDSIVVNSPEPFYHVPKSVASLGLVCLFLIVLLLVVFGLYSANRRKAAKELETSRQRYRAIFNSVNDAIFIHDPDTGKILQINDRGLAMYGLGKDEVENTTLAELSVNEPPYTVEDALEYIGLARAGEPQLFEWHARKKDGSPFWIEVNMRRAQIGDVLRIIVTVRDVSERKKMEQALRQSEELHRTLIDNIELGIALVDSNMKVKMANPAMGRIFGCEDKDFVGKNCFEIYGEDATPCSYCPGRQAMKTGRSEGGQRSAVSADGRKFPVSVRAFPLYGIDGVPSGFIEVIEDVGEKHRAEAERDRFFNLSLDLLCIAGFDGYFKQANPAWTEALGWSRDELQQKPWIEFVHPDDLAKTKKAGEKLLAGKSIFAFENRYRCKDGSYRWLSWNSLPLPDEQTIFAVVRDVTEQKSQREALRETRERIWNIVQSSPMGIYLYEADENDDLILLDANPAADRFTGIENQQLIGRKIEEAFPNLKDTEVPARYLEAALQGKPWQTTEFYYEDERILSRAYEIHAFQTSPRRMAVLFMDVTDRMQMEEQLRQSQKMESIGKLAGGVAHDFNNMLGGILGAAELLSKKVGSTDAAVHRYINLIIDTSSHAAELTEQLLAFSRKGKVENVLINVDELVEEVLVLLTHTVDPKIRLEKKLARDIAPVLGDRVLLQNALLNLVVNARDSISGEGVITISTEMVDLSEDYCHESSYDLSPGWHVRVSVTDTGCGMAPEIIGKIFEPFFTTKEVGQGTGLGLSAVYGTAKDHHGGIDVVSTVGKGSTFSLLLPRADADVVAKDTQAKQATESMEKLSILLIDDEEVIRMTTQDMLEDMGHSVVCAKDGREGLKCLKEDAQGFDIIILDVVMPHADGYDVLQQVLKVCGDIKVLLISGYTMGTNMGPMLEQGRIEFLHKPYTQDELMAALTHLYQ